MSLGSASLSTAASAGASNERIAILRSGSANNCRRHASPREEPSSYGSSRCAQAESDSVCRETAAVAEPSSVSAWLTVRLIHWSSTAAVPDKGPDQAEATSGSATKAGGVTQTESAGRSHAADALRS